MAEIVLLKKRKDNTATPEVPEVKQYPITIYSATRRPNKPYWGETPGGTSTLVGDLDRKANITTAEPPTPCKELANTDTVIQYIGDNHITDSDGKELFHTNYFYKCQEVIDPLGGPSTYKWERIDVLPSALIDKSLSIKNYDENNGIDTSSDLLLYSITSIGSSSDSISLNINDKINIENKIVTMVATNNLVNKETIKLVMPQTVVQFNKAPIGEIDRVTLAAGQSVELSFLFINYNGIQEVRILQEIFEAPAI